MKKVIIFLAEGFEEVEALTPIDFLRRAEVDVTTVGIGGKSVLSAHGVRVEADTALSELGNTEIFDGLVCPGGMPGATNIAAADEVTDLIAEFNRQGKTVAAICASPGIVLAGTGVLDGRQATCYPGFEEHFSSKTVFSEKRVVIDGNIITSRGPGTSAEFAIELVKIFADAEAAEAIRKGTLQNF
ncbi:MAG: DJ-1/PfpI family protein [Spirochaetales bacterium]|uniref:DJ-1/PfpI family protein n=1 Tax=Candidatus Thalassospirochaeta sargassi TaxID=3119039 RepID=A0AAJ1IJU9_9SPIO|nr:DJ-1/PfpI family protein [Spirochaetales bacterium]